MKILLWQSNYEIFTVTIYLRILGGQTLILNEVSEHRSASPRGSAGETHATQMCASNSEDQFYFNRIQVGL